MRINVRAAATACAAALPFAALASYSWIRAATDKAFPTCEAYHFGEMIYLLGAPLTLIVLGIPCCAGRYLDDGDNWWAIPMSDILFVLQWIIWSQTFCRAKPKYR
jgi:hypothetical protein